MANPGLDHWTALKWVMRHLRGTTNKGLLYEGGDDTMKSLFGYVFTLYGTAISWKSCSNML